MNFLALSNVVSSNGLSAGVLMQTVFDKTRADGGTVYEAARQAAAVAFAAVQYLNPNSPVVDQDSAVAAQNAALYYLTVVPNYVPVKGTVIEEARQIRDEILDNRATAKGVLIRAQELSTEKLKQDHSLLKQEIAKQEKALQEAHAAGAALAGTIDEKLQEAARIKQENAENCRTALMQFTGGVKPAYALGRLALQFYYMALAENQVWSVSKYAAAFATNAAKTNAQNLSGSYPIAVADIMHSVNLNMSGLAGENDIDWGKIGKDIAENLIPTVFADAVGVVGDKFKSMLMGGEAKALQTIKEKIAAATGTSAASVTDAQAMANPMYAQQLNAVMAMMAEKDADMKKLVAAMNAKNEPKPMSTTTKALIGGGAAAALLLILVVALRR